MSVAGKSGTVLQYRIYFDNKNSSFSSAQVRAVVFVEASPSADSNLTQPTLAQFETSLIKYP